MSNIDKIIKELTGLYNKEVMVFGNYQVIPAYNDNDLYVDIIDVLRNLKDIEVNDYLSSKILDLWANNSDLLTTVKSDNTYNYNCRLSNDIQINQVNYRNKDYTIICIHKYSDIRGNYTVDAVLEGNIDNMIYIISDVYKFIDIDVDGVTYNLDIYPLSEGIEVYDRNNDLSYTDYNAVDINDIKDNIRNEFKG